MESFTLIFWVIQQKIFLVLQSCVRAQCWDVCFIQLYFILSHAMGEQNKKQGTYNRTFLASRAWASRLTWETLRKEKFHVLRWKPTHPTHNQNFLHAHTQRCQVIDIHCLNRTVGAITFPHEAHWLSVWWCMLPCQLKISVGNTCFTQRNWLRLCFGE